MQQIKQVTYSNIACKTHDTAIATYIISTFSKIV